MGRAPVCPQRGTGRRPRRDSPSPPSPPHHSPVQEVGTGWQSGSLSCPQAPVGTPQPPGASEPRGLVSRSPGDWDSPCSVVGWGSRLAPCPGSAWYLLEGTATQTLVLIAVTSLGSQGHQACTVTHQKDRHRFPCHPQGRRRSSCEKRGQGPDPGLGSHCPLQSGGHGALPVCRDMTCPEHWGSMM